MTDERNLTVDLFTGMTLPAGVTISRTGLRLPANLSWDEYEAVGEHLLWMKERVEEAHDAVLWMIGDWLQHGEFEFGEKFSQAAARWDKSEKRLLNIQWVARSIPEERRHSDLSFRHHEEVASLGPADQDKLLQEAVDEGLTSWELRGRRRERQDLAKEYAWREAETALDRAATLLVAVPTASWASLIMAMLVKPLRHEIDHNTNRQFVRDLFSRMSSWRDAC